MEHGINIIKGGRIIHTSKNLRAMRDYVRVSPVARIESCDGGAMQLDGSAIVQINYED